MTDQQYAAIQWIRASKIGKVLQLDLQDRINAIREDYENTPANEQVRLTLNKYKHTYHLLFEQEL